MPKGNKIEIDGTVIESLPSACFKIRIVNQPGFPEDLVVTGYISGRMRMNYIKIIPGDRVRIELDPYDITKGRITFRYKENAPGSPYPPKSHPQQPQP